MLAHHAFGILWVKESPHIGALPLFQRKAVIIKRGPIVVKGPSVRPKLGDVKRREVKELSELAFALPELFLVLAQLDLRALQIVDVREHEVPAHDAPVRVAEGMASRLKPPISAVAPPET